MVMNIGDQYADKTIQHIQSNSQDQASKFWIELLNHAQQSNRTEELLSTVIIKSYEGKRENFYPILEFILRNKISTGFPLLYAELDTHGHLFGGQEVFVFAYYLKETCGTFSQLYESLPEVVRQSVSSPVMFKNQDNMGYMIATPLGTPCTDKTSCFGHPKPEVFIHKLTASAIAELPQNTRSHWELVPPVIMGMKNGFNGTRMSWGFHLKNVASDKYLIVRTRLTSFFLRENVTFDSYYSGDLQCQFIPTLVKGQNGKIMMGLKEKYLKKTEYFFASKFVKRDVKISLEKRNGYENEGKVWEVIAVPRQEINDMEGNSVTTENGNNSKCQF